MTTPHRLASSEPQSGSGRSCLSTAPPTERPTRLNTICTGHDGAAATRPSPADATAGGIASEITDGAVPGIRSCACRTRGTSSQTSAITRTR